MWSPGVWLRLLSHYREDKAKEVDAVYFLKSVGMVEREGTV